MNIKIHVAGHVDDLYALSLVFPDGAYPDLHVVTEIKGRNDGTLDRVSDADQRSTYVTGPGCMPLIEANHYGAASWVAREIIAPLNGYAVLADSNFKPVEPVSASFQGDGMQGMMSFGTPPVSWSIDRSPRAPTDSRLRRAIARSTSRARSSTDRATDRPRSLK